MKFFLTEDQIIALRLFTACSCGRMARMEMVGFFKDLVSNCKTKTKMCPGLFFLQKIDWCLRPEFQSNVFGSIKG